jgi:hypothetical protein
MPKLIAFATAGFTGSTKEFRSNDPDLTLNGDDFVVASAIVLTNNWTLYDDIGFTGNTISLGDSGGPDADGSYKDYADWQGSVNFHVKSIQHS